MGLQRAIDALAGEPPAKQLLDPIARATAEVQLRAIECHVPANQT